MFVCVCMCVNCMFVRCYMNLSSTLRTYETTPESSAPFENHMAHEWFKRRLLVLDRHSDACTPLQILLKCRFRVTGSWPVPGLLHQLLVMLAWATLEQDLQDSKKSRWCLGWTWFYKHRPCLSSGHSQGLNDCSLHQNPDTSLSLLPRPTTSVSPAFLPIITPVPHQPRHPSVLPCPLSRSGETPDRLQLSKPSVHSLWHAPLPFLHSSMWLSRGDMRTALSGHQLQKTRTLSEWFG